MLARLGAALAAVCGLPALLRAEGGLEQLADDTIPPQFGGITSDRLNGKWATSTNNLNHATYKQWDVGGPLPDPFDIHEYMERVVARAWQREARGMRGALEPWVERERRKL
jgi:hypothetical protein